MTRTMNCEQTRALLNAHYDGELDDSAARSVTAHLERCADCARARAALDTLGTFLRQHGTAKAPDRLLARINAGIKTDIHDDGQRTPGPLQWLLPRLVAAGLGAVVVGGAWWLADDRTEPTTTELQEPFASYLGRPALPIGRSVAFTDDMQRLRARPENQVLDWNNYDPERRRK